MRRLALISTVACLAVATAGVLASAPRAADAAGGTLIAESSRLIGLGEIDTAYRLLNDIFLNSKSDEDRFDAAILLAAFPAGSEAYKEREKYARFALTHPRAKQKLGKAERTRLVRTTGLGSFAAGKWDDARDSFEQLQKSDDPDDRGIALLHAGWIDINEKKQDKAVLLWLEALERGGFSERWKSSISRDLGRAWVESGAMSLEVSNRFAKVLAEASEPIAFREGMKAGLTRIANDSVRMGSLRAFAAQGALRAQIRAIFIEDYGLLQQSPCELLSWLDPRESVQSWSATSAHRVEDGLRTCWNSNADGLNREQILLLLAVLGDLMKERSDASSRILLAQIAEAAEQWDRACSEYIASLVTAEAQAGQDRAEATCRHVSKESALSLKKRLLDSWATSAALAGSIGAMDALFAVEKDPVSRQAVLEERFADPARVRQLSDKRPILWWLDALSSLASEQMNRSTRENWSVVFLEDRSIWQGLRLTPEQQLLLKLEISRSANRFSALNGELLALEIQAAKSAKLRRAYIQWLEEYSREALEGRVQVPPSAPKTEIARDYFAAVREFLTNEPLSGGAIHTLHGSSALLSGASFFRQARAKLRQAEKISLNLASPSFPSKLSRKLSLMQAGAALLKKSVGKVPSVRERAAQVLGESVGLVQSGISKLEAPALWPDREKRIWTEQRVLLAKQLEGAVQL